MGKKARQAGRAQGLSTPHTQLLHGYGNSISQNTTMSTHQDMRMYENKYPEVDDCIMVQVKSIAEMGAYVSLLEYNGIEGMILLSELSRRRIRSITKLIKVKEAGCCH